VRVTLCTGSAGFKFVMLYWNPDAGVFLSDMVVSSRLTPANERR
jgi:hypothetical protein